MELAECESVKNIEEYNEGSDRTGFDSQESSHGTMNAHISWLHINLVGVNLQ